MAILYQVSFIITAFGAAVIASNVIFKKAGARTRFDIFYSLMAISLIIWAIGRYGLLITEQYSSALFWTHFLYVGSILVYVFFLHTILIFLDIDNKRKILLIVFYINSIFLLILNGVDLISGSNYFIKDVIPKLDFNYYEVPSVFYNLHLINYIFIPFYALFEMFLAFRRVDNIKKQQIKFIIFSSVLGFLGGNSVVPLVYNFQIEPIFLILVPFHLLTLTYAITKHGLFNIKVIATELLVFAVWVFLLIRTLLAESWQERIIDGSLFVLIVFFGILIIKSVLKEVKQKETFKELSEELEKLNAQLRTKTTYLTALQDFTADITQSLDFKTIIQKIVDEIPAKLNYVAALLLLLTPDRKRGYLAAISSNQAVRIGMRFLPKPVSEYFADIEGIKNLFSEILNTGLVKMSDRYSDFITPPVPKWVVELIQKATGVKSVAGIPVKIEEKISGAILFLSGKPKENISQDELEVMQALANQVGIVLKNASLYEQIKVANEKLVEMDKLKAGMYSFVSHQIKAPIGIVKGFAELLMQDSYGKIPKKAKETLENIKKSADRLIQLVEDFLDLRRMEEGKMDFQFKDVDIVDLVKSVVDELKVLAEQKNLEFTFNMGTFDVQRTSDVKKIVVKADEQRLRQVFQNLIENSIKYTQKGFVRVEINMGTSDVQKLKSISGTSDVLITVSDSGIGIKPEVLPEIFDQFKRAQAARTIKGSGLGLYIAKQIVETHKGEIWAESEGEGKGSRFYVRLAAGR